MWRLLTLNRPEWGYLGLGMLVSAALGAVMPIFALLLAELIGARRCRLRLALALLTLTLALPTSPSTLHPGLFFHADTPEANQKAQDDARLYSLLFVALGVSQLVCSTLQSFCFSTMGVRLAERVRVMLFRAVLRQEVSWFDRDENSSGAITTRLSSDAATVRGATGDVLGILIQNLVTLVAGFAIAFSAGWKMTLVVIAVLPLIVFSSFMQMKFYMGGKGWGKGRDPGPSCAAASRHAITSPPPSRSGRQQQ